MTNQQDTALLPVGQADREADRLLQEFYLSTAYDPKALRPADVVKAAIAFTLAAHRLQAKPEGREGAEGPMVLIEVERNAEGEVMICTGCGTVETVRSIRARTATAFTCCPERKMVRAADLGDHGAEQAKPSASGEAGEVERLREALETIAQNDEFPLDDEGNRMPIRPQWSSHQCSSIARAALSSIRSGAGANSSGLADTPAEKG